MDYQGLLNSFEKICVLVTLTYFLSRTDVFARLFVQITRPRDKLLTFLFFSSLALVEVVLSPETSPLNARIVASTAAGLLGGASVGVGVGVFTAVVEALVPGAGVSTDGIAAAIGGILGGWVCLYTPTFRPKIIAGFLVGALSHTLWLGIVFSADFLVASSWDALLLQYSLPVLVNGAAVALFLVIIGDMRTQQVRIQKQTAAVAHAELKALQAQVHPHFLFNALNTLAALCELDPKRAGSLIVKLGDFFRSSLRSDRDLMCSLNEELQVVRSYLEIEKARFGERLVIVEDIEEDALSRMVPSFTLQPLVENAVIHGLAKKPGPGSLRITVRLKKDRLVCWVVDDGRGIDAEKLETILRTGKEMHALPMLKNRLAAVYSGKFGIKLRSKPGRGTLVCIWIPVTTVEKSQISAYSSATMNR